MTLSTDSVRLITDNGCRFFQINNERAENTNRSLNKYAKNMGEGKKKKKMCVWFYCKRRQGLQGGFSVLIGALQTWVAVLFMG